MAAKSLPEQSVLLQLLRYDPETGKLFWRERDIAWFSDGYRTASHEMRRWNSCWAGKPALSSVAPSGNLHGKVLGNAYLAHRVIWKLVTGDEPVVIDHINGCPSDNRFCNLRSVTQHENCKNARLRKDCSSSMSGIRRRGASWVASIGNGKSTQHVLQSPCLGKVISARMAAIKNYGFHKNHGRETQ